METLRRLKDEGLIEQVGLAGGPIEMSVRYVQTGAFEAVITHNRYTLLNRSAAPLLDVARERGLALVNAAPYGSGILAKGPQAYPRYAYQDAPRRCWTACAGWTRSAGATGAPRRRRLAVLPARPARRLHHRGHEPGADRPDPGAGPPPDPGRLWPELDGVGYSTEDPETGRWK